MPADPTRREELAQQATDYVLDHGLIGLSLRPLAAELGTSDRMLLYHFADKDDLVATVLRVSNDRSVAALVEQPAADDVATYVRRLWRAARQGPLWRCQRVYVEAAALGLFGLEPYASTVRASNEHWMRTLAGGLESAGCPAVRARRAANLVESVLVGLLLDQPLSPESEQAAVVEDLAVAVTAMAVDRGD
jgi:AcrR family transcriptional regulator